MIRISYIAILLMLCSCGPEETKRTPEIDWSREDSTILGESLAQQEVIDIKLFLEMHKDWKMITTGSGLQYYIYEEGIVDTFYTPKAGNEAKIEFSISLLDGTECYKTASDEYESFLVDNSEIETGVQEGIKKMSIGDRAKLIIPSHLGHGLVGDMDKIPPLTVLVIDIYLIGIVI
jgi:FKBP-type peptidyl-prolyl cis-trans isomerase